MFFSYYKEDDFEWAEGPFESMEDAKMNSNHYKTTLINENVHLVKCIKTKLMEVTPDDYKSYNYTFHIITHLDDEIKQDILMGTYSSLNELINVDSCMKDENCSVKIYKNLHKMYIE